MTMMETLLDGLGKAAAPATSLAAMLSLHRRRRHALPAWAAQSAAKRRKLPS